MIQNKPTIDEIFFEALRLSTVAERAAFLDAACADDPSCRRRVEQLLAAYPQANHFLEAPAVPHSQPDTFDVTHENSGDASGTQIGPYKLLEQIGEGGMGVVYVAEQTKPVRRRVALKIIKPGMDTKQVVARFEAERQALAMMDHPNIAKILDAGTVGPVCRTGPDAANNSALPPTSIVSGRPYFVMELVRGMPITDYCDKACLSPRQRLELLITVCQAVQHAHQKGIIHRDLKPSNVMVTMHDGRPMAKVIDFGIAKAIGQQLTDLTIYTAHTQLVGTPLYMSPEQAELSSQDVDTRSDVYSLGVLLYELLTGQTPFDKDKLSKAGFDEMRRIIREDEPPRPSHRVSTLGAPALSTISHHRGIDNRALNRVLRGELDWIVMKALAKIPSERFESASALAADIQRYLTDEPVQACPPSTLYRVQKFANKHRATFTTATLLAASLVAGTTLSLWQAMRATAAEAQATANESKAKTLAESEAEQRKAAESNFRVALEALDRMLENVSAPELNDVLKVGPLRRKILNDAVAFFSRIGGNLTSSPESQYQAGETWYRIAELAANVDDSKQRRMARNAAMRIMAKLVKEFPNEPSYRLSLARIYHGEGWDFAQVERNREQAVRSFRRAAELYEGLASEGVERDLVYHANSYKGMGDELVSLGRYEEAADCLTKAIGIVPDSRSFQHWVMVLSLAQLRNRDRFEEADALFRQASDGFRRWIARSRDEGWSDFQLENEFAWCLIHTAGAFRQRHRGEAEALLNEAIEFLKSAIGVGPPTHYQLVALITAMNEQAANFRKASNEGSSEEGREKTDERLHRAEKLTLEAIGLARQNVSRFAAPGDRYQLVRLLGAQSRFLLQTSQNVNGSPLSDPEQRRFQADAFLTESIQLCRGLVAELPENAQYKSHLAALIKLQTQHFLRPEAADQPKTETKPPPKPDGD